MRRERALVGASWGGDAAFGTGGRMTGHRYRRSGALPSSQRVWPCAGRGGRSRGALDIVLLLYRISYKIRTTTTVFHTHARAPQSVYIDPLRDRSHPQSSLVRGLAHRFTHTPHPNFGIFERLGETERDRERASDGHHTAHHDNLSLTDGVPA